MWMLQSRKFKSNLIVDNKSNPMSKANYLKNIWKKDKFITEKLSKMQCSYINSSNWNLIEIKEHMNKPQVLFKHCKSIMKNWPKRWRGFIKRNNSSPSQSSKDFKTTYNRYRRNLMKIAIKFLNFQHKYINSWRNSLISSQPSQRYSNKLLPGRNYQELMPKAPFWKHINN